MPRSTRNPTKYREDRIPDEDGYGTSVNVERQGDGSWDLCVNVYAIDGSTSHLRVFKLTQKEVKRLTLNLTNHLMSEVPND